MRIGIYDPYLDDLGGGEKYMMSVAAALSKKHEVSVFWDNQKDIDSLLQRFSLDLSKVRRVKNIFAPNVSLLERLPASRQYDSIIVLSDGSIPILLSKKLFLHVQQPLHIAKKGFWSAFKMSRVDKIFCNSNFTKNFVDPSFIKKTVVIFPPVTLYPEKVKKENIILHVGRFRVKNVAIGDYKKQSIMVDEFKNMIDKGLKDWKFVLAVSIMERDKEIFKKLVESTKGYPIEFAINKSNKELWDLYSLAKIYWHASGYGEDLGMHPEYAEHFGISTVEAMGAGAVPVVINAGGQKEIVTNLENGLLWNSLKELKDKTLQLINKPALLEKLSVQAKHRAQDFTYEKFSDSVNKLIG